MASHLSLYTPFPSGGTTKISFQKLPSFFHGRTRAAVPNRRLHVLAEKSDNLDHLQRMSASQSHTKRAPQVAPQGPWDRFPTARTVQQMMDAMERIMDDPFAYSNDWRSVPFSGREGYSRGRTPWAIKEREKDYKMRFDMPGMTKEDVKVWVEEKMLVVKAEKAAKKTKDQVVEGGGDVDEWPTKSYGRYSCRITLPENIEFENIKAEVKDGVLYITIPKADQKTKVIDINVQ